MDAFCCNMHFMVLIWAIIIDMLFNRLKQCFSVLKTSSQIVGIDLGTTNSCVAVI